MVDVTICTVAAHSPWPECDGMSRPVRSRKTIRVLTDTLGRRWLKQRTHLCSQFETVNWGFSSQTGQRLCAICSTNFISISTVNFPRPMTSVRCLLPNCQSCTPSPPQKRSSLPVVQTYVRWMHETWPKSYYCASFGNFFCCVTEDLQQIRPGCVYSCNLITVWVFCW